MKNLYYTPIKKRTGHRKLFLFFLIILATAGALGWKWMHTDTAVISDNATLVTEPANATEAPAPDNATNATTPDTSQEQPPTQTLPFDLVQVHDIADGDTLSAIFDQCKISQTTLFQIMDADEQILALDILRPGNKLTFTFNATRELEQMELYINPARQVLYHRVDADNFEYEEINKPGRWEQQALAGNIQGSFYQSAQEVGLSDQEVASIADLFKSRLHFSKDMREKDYFQVVRRQQFVGDEFTGDSEILGVRISCRGKIYDSYLFSDGKYYDHEGNSLIRAFTRYPFKGKFRLSSPFNPARCNPVTKRIAPHNGADFCMPVGTPIFAPGDGVVVRTMQHRFAGNYIEIRHNDLYSTRYLHLSKILVHKGQQVQRGDRIALSGNTGRSTGPHLHYEFHIQNRAVNPVTAPIPVMASIPRKEHKAFKSKVAELDAAMKRALAEKNQEPPKAMETN